MGSEKFEGLPKEAVPLTRHRDIKLVLDTPKGMFDIVPFSCNALCTSEHRRGGYILWKCMLYKPFSPGALPGLIESQLSVLISCFTLFYMSPTSVDPTLVSSVYEFSISVLLSSALPEYA